MEKANEEAAKLIGVEEKLKLKEAAKDAKTSAAKSKQAAEANKRRPKKKEKAEAKAAERQKKTAAAANRKRRGMLRRIQMILRLPMMIQHHGPPLQMTRERLRTSFHTRQSNLTPSMVIQQHK